MKTVLIYCHPRDIAKEETLLKTIVADLEIDGQTVPVYNIFGDVFSSVLLSSAQLELSESEDLDIVIKSIQNNIADAKQIIFLFPYYWEGLATYIRRFIDKVFLSDLGTGSVFTSNKKLKNHKAIIITSMKIPQILFSSINAKGYSDPFTVNILKLCGIRNIKWFNIGKWSSRNAQARERKLKKIREYVHSI